MILTEEGREELLRRVSIRITESSDIAYICSAYMANNTHPFSPEDLAEYILSCTFRQSDDGEYELVAPSGENVRFLILCARPITEIINSELEDTISKVQFKYKTIIYPEKMEM